LEHFILLISYTRAKSAAVFDYTRLKRLSRNKHSNLFVPFVSYEETEDLRIHTQSAQRKCIVGTAWRVHYSEYMVGGSREAVYNWACVLL
jgi:hypothetical protein